MIAVALLITAASVSLDDAGWRLTEVGPGVWAAVAYPVESGGPLCNAGIVDLGGRALVFDASYSPRHGQALREAAAKLVGAPVMYLVNSHGHGDHTRGNQAFDDVVIVGTSAMGGVMKKEWPADPKKSVEGAHKRLVDEQKKIVDARARGDAWAEQEARLWATLWKTDTTAPLTLKPPRAPDVLVTSSVTLRGTRRSVEVIELGKAHSASDVALFVPDAGVVFTGDVVFSGMHPYLADGDVGGLRAALATLRGLKASVVVPGHGQVGTPAALDEMDRYLDAVVAVVANLRRQNAKPGDAAVPPAFEKWHLRRFFFANVGFLASIPK